MSSSVQEPNKLESANMKVPDEAQPPGNYIPSYLLFCIIQGMFD